MEPPAIDDGLPSNCPQLASALERGAEVVIRSRGSLLFEQGQPAAGVYVVRRGKVRLRLACATGQHTYRTVAAGYILGLPSAVSNEPYSLTAEVLEDAELAFVGRARVIALLRSRNDLSMQLVTLLADEVRRMRQQASVLAGDHSSS